MPLSERSSVSAHVQVGPRATVIRISTRPRVRRFFGASLVERTSSASWPLGHHLVTQATGERDPCLIRALPHRELPGPPPDRILTTHRVHGDFHQRKAQPRRTFAGDPTAPIPVRAGVDARHQSRVTRQCRTDCTTPAGKLQLHILAALAEFERGRIQERVKAGLARAKAQGVKLGRPRRRIAPERLAEVAGLPAREAARRLAILSLLFNAWPKNPCNLLADFPRKPGHSDQRLSGPQSDVF